MSATLRDVAKLAGVSFKTVSNVVNGYPHVRPATREKVERAIAELGYKPNPSARSLRSGRTGAIALAVPELNLSYFAELASFVIASAERSGLVTIVEQTNGDRDRELALLQSPVLRMTDGLILSPSAWVRTTPRPSMSPTRWCCWASRSSTGPTTTSP
ncbi:hypothetical protein GCM10029992_32410 [Glycomyces albus]